MHVLNKNENVINAFERDFLKIAKINSQQEKLLCPNRKNKLPQKFRAMTFCSILQYKSKGAVSTENFTTMKQSKSQITPLRPVHVFQTVTDHARVENTIGNNS